MTTKPFIRQANVALNIPDDVNEVVASNNAIIIALEGNPLFPELALKVTELRTSNKLLEATEASFNSMPQKATKNERDDVLLLVIKNLRAIGRGVQELADADVTHAATIITSAGLAVKKSAGRTKVVNTAEDGDEDGSVVLTGQASGPHDWRISTDELNWSYLPSSLMAKTIVRNLVSGTVYYFQNRRMLANSERGEWSASIKIRIQ